MCGNKGKPFNYAHLLPLSEGMKDEEDQLPVAVKEDVFADFQEENPEFKEEKPPDEQPTDCTGEHPTDAQDVQESHDEMAIVFRELLSVQAKVHPTYTQRFLVHSIRNQSVHIYSYRFSSPHRSTVRPSAPTYVQAALPACYERIYAPILCYPHRPIVLPPSAGQFA